MADEELIPEHKSGVQTNTESSAEFETAAEASRFFPIVKERLLDVNRWHDLAGKATASFQLTDKEGREVQRPARQGDRFKIDVPAPGTVTGDGHDWVQIEAIEEKPDSVSIRVRPCTNPDNDRQDVAHFFSDEATSSFVVRLEGRKVMAGVYGRNEKPNTQTETVADTIRNAAVAIGAMTGFSKLQWKSLVNGLVRREEER